MKLQKNLQRIISKASPTNQIMYAQPPVDSQTGLFSSSKKASVLRRAVDAMSPTAIRHPDGYMQREKLRRFIDQSHKVTWESIQKLETNELKGITNSDFDPSKFIGG